MSLSLWARNFPCHGVRQAATKSPKPTTLRLRTLSYEQHDVSASRDRTNTCENAGFAGACLRVNIQCCGAPCHENRSTGVENSSAASSGVLGAFSDMRDDVVAAKAANNDSYNNTNACCLIVNAGQDTALASDICDRKLGEFSSYLILRCRASKTASLGRKFEYH